MKARAQSMLTSIERFEQNNLKKLLGTITTGALDKVKSSMEDPEKRAEIDEQFFQSALQGIRAGVMRYENDPLLPIVNKRRQLKNPSPSSLVYVDARYLPKFIHF